MIAECGDEPTVSFEEIKNGCKKMDSSGIRWKKLAECDLRNIPTRQIPRLIKAIDSLAKNPFPVQHRKL